MSVFFLQTPTVFEALEFELILDFFVASEKDQARGSGAPVISSFPFLPQICENRHFPVALSTCCLRNSATSWMNYRVDKSRLTAAFMNLSHLDHRSKHSEITSSAALCQNNLATAVSRKQMDAVLALFKATLGPIWSVPLRVLTNGYIVPLESAPCKCAQLSPR